MSAPNIRRRSSLSSPTRTITVAAENKAATMIPTIHLAIGFHLLVSGMGYFTVVIAIRAIPV